MKINFATFKEDVEFSNKMLVTWIELDTLMKTAFSITKNVFGIYHKFVSKPYYI